VPHKSPRPLGAYIHHFGPKQPTIIRRTQNMQLGVQRAYNIVTPCSVSFTVIIASSESLLSGIFETVACRENLFYCLSPQNRNHRTYNLQENEVSEAVTMKCPA